MDTAEETISRHAGTQVTARRGVERTGPVSRLFRLGLAVLVAWSAMGLVIGGVSQFSQPDIPRQVDFWFLVALVAYGIPDGLSDWFGRRTGRRITIGLATVFVAGVGVAVASHGTVWAAPTTWLVYGLALAWLSSVAVALLISVVIGAPGCELGAVRELAQRVRGTFDATTTDVGTCVVGLHRLDRWEARQPWRR